MFPRINQGGGAEARSRQIFQKSIELLIKIPNENF